MKYIFLFLTIFLSISLNAQKEFHVFPKDDINSPGSKTGDGSLENPWDLQTALSKKTDVVKSGDTIWIHQGIYNGRYRSTLQSEVADHYITVSAYRNDKVTLNGNVSHKQTSVLQVRSKQVVFKNFEVTWIGDFSRDKRDAGFENCIGIEHLNGENCRYYNLTIHDNPGLGFGSWKRTGGTIIENCMIYNNGIQTKPGRGGGEGMYVQNESEDLRLIKNNIIFNNYYKGIEVWSAGKRSDFEFVKNITLEGNIVFNNGFPSGPARDNIIVASNDQNGINYAHDITLKNNVLYHNTYKANGELRGEAPSLTLGYSVKAPIKDVVVSDNVIFGGNDAVRLSIAQSLDFMNNKVYGAMIVGPNTTDFIKDWNFSGNRFYAKDETLFRISRGEKHTLASWQDTYGQDLDSEFIDRSKLDIPHVLHLSQHSQDIGKFHLALFDAEGKDVSVDFSAEGVAIGQPYKVYDVENPSVILISGIVPEDYKITIPMGSTAFEGPLHNEKAVKTSSNFGVFKIEFEITATQDVQIETQESALERFLKWLGF